MFTQYFGHFLLNKEIVTPAQLQSAMDQVHTTHLKLGILSVNAGYMTAPQAVEVHQMQTRVDKRFGELAIELGYLNDDQLEHLLASQKESHLVLAQALIDQGAITLEQFSDTLLQYKEANYLSDDQFEAIKNGDIDVLLPALLKVEDSRDMAWVQSYLSLLAKNLIRFIDPQVHFEVNKFPQNYQAEWLVSQEVTGSISFTSRFSLTEPSLLQIASAYAEEPMTNVDDIAKDSVGEFLNLNNGLFLVNMSNDGVELGLVPQSTQQNVQLQSSTNQFLITVHLTNGSFDLILS